MVVRGAPAIAIAGALAVAVQLTNEGQGKQYATAKQAQEAVQENLSYLVTRFATLLWTSSRARRIRERIDKHGC